MTTNRASRSQPAYWQVAEQLRARILHGELGPGDRLPSEAELSEQHGVSRSTVREALRSLASQSLLTTQRGVTGGSFVAHPDAVDISSYLETGVGLMSSARIVAVGELIEARAILEVPAARLAAERRTDAHVAALQGALDQEASAPDHRFEDHHATHAAILEAAGNGLLLMLTRPIFAVLRSRFARDRAPGTFWRQVGADHQRIVRAIVDGDADGAAAAMDEHLRSLAGTYERIDAQR